VPIAAEATTSAGLRVAVVASEYTAVDSTTGCLPPMAAYRAPRKKTSSAAPLARVVSSTSGSDPWWAYRRIREIAVLSTGRFRAASALA
jgi:hypothetical protein